MPETSAVPVPVRATVPAPVRSPVRALLREAALDAWGVLLPVACSGCGSPDRALCSDCDAQLLPDHIETTLETGHGLLQVVSALRYEGVPRRVILALKEQGRTDAARALSRGLEHAIPLAVRGEVELVTVPSSRAAFRRRGFVPVELLLKRAGYRVPRRVLEPTRASQAQKTLDRASRELNLRESLRARHPLAGRRLLLVDDVLTTGATLIEATRALEVAGARISGAVTLAATPLHHAEGSLHASSGRNPEEVIS